MELVGPGAVPVPLWRPEAGADQRPIGQHGGLGRKP
ncbi:hypothetical protein [Streptomyces sp. NPDC101234]